MKHEEFERLAHTNPHVKAWLMEWRAGRCSYVEALEAIAVTLAEMNDRLFKERKRDFERFAQPILLDVARP